MKYTYLASMYAHLREQMLGVVDDLLNVNVYAFVCEVDSLV